MMNRIRRPSPSQESPLLLQVFLHPDLGPVTLKMLPLQVLLSSALRPPVNKLGRDDSPQHPQLLLLRDAIDQALVDAYVEHLIYHSLDDSRYSYNWESNSKLCGPEPEPVHWWREPCVRNGDHFGILGNIISDGYRFCQTMRSYPSSPYVNEDGTLRTTQTASDAVKIVEQKQEEQTMLTALIESIFEPLMQRLHTTVIERTLLSPELKRIGVAFDRYHHHPYGKPICPSLEFGLPEAIPTVIGGVSTLEGLALRILEEEFSGGSPSSPLQGLGTTDTSFEEILSAAFTKASPTRARLPRLETFGDSATVEAEVVNTIIAPTLSLSVSDISSDSLKKFVIELEREKRARAKEERQKEKEEKKRLRAEKRSSEINREKEEELSESDTDEEEEVEKEKDPDWFSFPNPLRDMVSQLKILSATYGQHNINLEHILEACPMLEVLSITISVHVMSGKRFWYKLDEVGDLLASSSCGANSLRSLTVYFLEQTASSRDRYLSFLRSLSRGCPHLKYLNLSYPMSPRLRSSEIIEFPQLVAVYFTRNFGDLKGPKWIDRKGDEAHPHAFENKISEGSPHDRVVHTKSEEIPFSTLEATQKEKAADDYRSQEHVEYCPERRKIQIVSKADPCARLHGVLSLSSPSRHHSSSSSPSEKEEYPPLVSMRLDTKDWKQGSPAAFSPLLEGFLKSPSTASNPLVLKHFSVSSHQVQLKDEQILSLSSCANLENIELGGNGTSVSFLLWLVKEHFPLLRKFRASDVSRRIKRAITLSGDDSEEKPTVLFCMSPEQETQLGIPHTIRECLPTINDCPLLQHFTFGLARGDEHSHPLDPESFYTSAFELKPSSAADDKIGAKNGSSLWLREYLEAIKGNPIFEYANSKYPSLDGFQLKKRTVNR